MLLSQTMKPHRFLSITTNRSSLGKLDSIVSRMKVSKDDALFRKIKSHGCSDLFNYATNKRFKKSELVSNHLLRFEQTKPFVRPLNGLEDLIKLTEEGKLWHFPIDNEQGLEAEKKVPFEDHVFFDGQLEDFPKLQFIQSSMRTVTSGLARNHWMSVKRKHEVIKFYRDFFEENKHLYENVKTAKPPPAFQ